MVFWFLCTHPYADPSVECKNGVNVALHNYCLSIIIIILKKESAGDVPGGPRAYAWPRS